MFIFLINALALPSRRDAGQIRKWKGYGSIAGRTDRCDQHVTLRDLQATGSDPDSGSKYEQYAHHLRNRTISGIADTRCVVCSTLPLPSSPPWPSPAVRTTYYTGPSSHVFLSQQHLYPREKKTCQNLVTIHQANQRTATWGTALSRARKAGLPVRAVRGLRAAPRKGRTRTPATSHRGQRPACNRQRAAVSLPRPPGQRTYPLAARPG